MARRSVRLIAAVAAVATLAGALTACGNKQATTDENGKPIVNILVRRNVTDHPMQDTQYSKDLEAACDCTIKWQEVADNAWDQQKSAKMAAGEFPRHRPEPVQHGRRGQVQHLLRGSEAASG